MLIREIEPAAGTVQIDGKDINAMPSDRTPYLRRRIGTVFQDFKLLPNRNVYDNVAYALQVIGEPRSQIGARCRRSSASSGCRRRSTAIRTSSRAASSSASRSPRFRQTSAAPARRRADRQPRPRDLDRIMQLLYRINRTGRRVLVVTHDREMVDKMQRRVIALEEGRLVRDEHSSGYHEDESTKEFAARVRAEMGIEGDELPGFEH